MEQIATYEQIFIDRVCAYFNTTYAKSFKNKHNRSSEHVMLRNLVFYYLGKHTKLSLVEIGEFYCKNYATVLYGKNSIKTLIETNYDIVVMHTKKLDSIAVDILVNHILTNDEKLIPLKDVYEAIKESLGVESLAKFKIFYNE